MLNEDFILAHYTFILASPIFDFFKLPKHNVQLRIIFSFFKNFVIDEHPSCRLLAFIFQVFGHEDFIHHCEVSVSNFTDFVREVNQFDNVIISEIHYWFPKFELCSFYKEKNWLLLHSHSKQEKAWNVILINVLVKGSHILWVKNSWVLDILIILVINLNDT